MPTVRATVALTMMLLFALAASPDRANASFPGDNGRFVFTWSWVNEERGFAGAFLATANSQGRDLRVLADCFYGCNHGSGDWSPNGRRVVYVDEQDTGGARLVTRRADGSDRKRVHWNGGLLSSPVWSPDGRRIAFVEWRWSDRVGAWVSDIYVIRRDGTHLTRVTRTRRSESQLDWSTRNRLVFVRSGELFTMWPNGRGLRRLTDNDVRESQPDWAPGGWRLTFVRRAEIWKMGASGEDASMIASGYSPTWAPDGSLVGFIGAADGAIHTVKPSGDDDTSIGTPVEEGSISELDWQPRASAAFLVRPNVVIIETDDQNLESLRVMANVGTLLAAQGTTFQNSVASYPFCCPSRATLLTGQYAHNHGVQSNHAPSGGYSKLDHANALPVWLTRAGYYTAFVGKYLNQYGNEDPYERPPGYNEWYAAVGGSSLVYYNYRLNENGRIVAYGADPASYQTDVYARRAVDVIRRRAPQAQPFFLWLSVLAPHRDWNKSSAVPAPRHLNRFASAPLPRPPSFNEADVSDKPARIRTLALLTETQIGSLTQRYRRYLESLLAVDEAVAAVVRALADTGELANTLIVFTSDNGLFHGEHRVAYGKIMLYEPSARVPLIVRGPGFPAGLRIRQPVANVDLAPTIVEAAGAVAGREPDGRSLRALAEAPATGDGRALLLEAKLGGYVAVRTARWLYAESTNGERELYDLVADPYELRSLHADPALAQLRAQLASRLSELKACKGYSCRG
jgi:arylsulfatase A-like enzyme/Tol biopolymer transport system component